jgi:hypothetical protein
MSSRDHPLSILAEDTVQGFTGGIGEEARERDVIAVKKAEVLLL